jgi:uncharacterized protein YceK
MIRPQSTRKAQVKTILMLIVGLMLAGCGSTHKSFRAEERIVAVNVKNFSPN